jgi:hypothetical protein
LCIKLVLIKELYYDARSNKSQDSRRYIPFNSFYKILNGKKFCIKLVLIKELYYDARPNKSQDSRRYFPFISFYKILNEQIFFRIYTQVDINTQTFREGTAASNIIYSDYLEHFFSKFSNTVIPLESIINYILCFTLGNSTASEFYFPMFRSTLSVPSS